MFPLGNSPLIVLALAKWFSQANIEMREDKEGEKEGEVREDKERETERGKWMGRNLQIEDGERSGQNEGER